MMIQDIAPHRLFNQYDPSARAAENDTVLILRGTCVAVDPTDGIRFPCVGELPDGCAEQLIYLFTVDSERYFLYPENNIELASYPFSELKALREAELQPKHRIFAALTGKHLADWYRDTRFCGRCGRPMVHSSKERAKVCSSCGYTAYPRIMPAVIVGVINGNKLLLTKYSKGYNHNALVAGFSEIGETMEETVAREVMEEVGLKVRNIRYYKSQPWGVANDILLGYYCDVDGSDEIHMDANELKQAVWTAREDIVLQPDHSSLTNEMMERFKNGESC